MHGCWRRGSSVGGEAYNLGKGRRKSLESNPTQQLFIHSFFDFLTFASKQPLSLTLEIFIMLSKSIILSLASVAVAGPIAPRQLSGFPGLGGGSTGGSSGFPGLGGGSSGGIPSIPSIPSGGSGSLPTGFPGLGGGSTGGSSGFPGLGGGSSGGIPSIPSIPSGGSTTGGDTTEEDSSSSTPSLPSGGSSNTPNFLGSTGTGSGSGFSGSTQNGLSGDCKDVTIIFARGTSEMGNVGSVAGPPFFQALAEKIGNDKLAVQGVEYAASAAGIAQMGDKAGSEKM